MNTLLVALNWLLVGGIVLGAAGAWFVVGGRLRAKRRVGVDGWLLLVSVVVAAAVQIPRCSSGLYMTARPGPTWVIKNPWALTVETLRPGTPRRIVTSTQTDTRSVSSDYQFQEASGESHTLPTARTLSASWEALTVEAEGRSWTFDSPPDAAELGYPPDIVQLIGVRGRLDPHTFTAEGPVFGQSEGRRLLSSATKGDSVEVFWGDVWLPATIVALDESRFTIRREGVSATDSVRPFLVRSPREAGAVVDPAERLASLREGALVSVMYKGKWWAAIVLEINPSKGEAPVKVRYAGYGSEWDEWIPLGRLRVR